MGGADPGHGEEAYASGVTPDEHPFAPEWWWAPRWGRLVALAYLPPDHDPAPGPGGGRALSDQSWRGLAVGLAIAIAAVLLLVAVAVATRGGADEGATTAATDPPSTGVGSQTVPSTTAGQPTTSGPPTTRPPTPATIVAADDRRIVVLDQSGDAAPRTLFDLGPSSSSDQQPPIIGGVSLSSDGTSAFFDVVGALAAGAMKRVPVTGGPAQDIGAGVAPVPSPDGSMLALIQAPEPDEPATLVVRAAAGGNERRFDLGDGTCGNIAWAPSRREVAVDLCSAGEPLTVAIIDIATAGVRPLTAPEGTTWSVPAFKADGTLTLVEQRETDAAVVALTAERSAVAATLLRRPSTAISTIDWSAAGDLLVCDVDGIVVAAIGGTRTQQVASGFTAAAW